MIPCECFDGPRDFNHLAFCPAREPDPVRCIGILHWAPRNQQCLSCGHYGQRCDRKPEPQR